MLLAHSAFAQGTVFVLRPATSYRALELGVPAGWIGAVSASFAVVPLVLALPSGRIVDRLGERSVAIAGAVFTCLAAVGFLTIGDSVAGLVACSVLLGTGHLGSAVAQQSIVANTARTGGYDTAFGHYTFACSLGQAAGPLVIIVFGGGQAIPDTTPIFAACAVGAGMVLLGALLLRSGTTRRQRAAPAPVGVRELLRLPGLFRALATSCVFLAAVDILLVYLPALGAERGLASGFVGLLLGLRAAAAMSSRLFLGRLARLAGRRALLLTSTAAATAGMCLIAAPVPPWLVALAVVAAGFALGVGQPLMMSWLAESAPAGARGRAMSLRLTGNRAGQVVIPSTVGVIAVAIGSSGVLYLTAAGLALVGTAARRLRLDARDMAGRPQGD